MARINIKKELIALLLLVFPLYLIAENQSQQQSPNSFDKTTSFVHQQMKNDIYSNKEKIKELQIKLDQSTQKVDSLEKRIKKLHKKVHGYQISNKKGIATANSSIHSLNESIEFKTMIGEIAMGIIIVILITTVILLKKKTSALTSSLKKAQDAQKALENGQKLIENGTVQLDNKVTDLLGKQLASSKQPTSSDHSLALKVADEIVRIETNLYRMDPATRGYKQLTRSIQRMKDCFMTKGYEISDLLGKPYNEGMKVVANFVIDESLPEGKAIITGIIKPQIIYNGKMIQAAQITVSQNI